MRKIVSPHLAGLLFLGLAVLSPAADKKGKPSAPATTDSPTAAPASELGVAPDKTGMLPPLTDALSDIAARAFSRRDWDKARDTYLEMLRSDPTNALTFANLGAVEQQSGHPKEAKEYFLKAVSLNPNLQQSWLALGLLSHQQGDQYLALSALSRAVFEDPTDPKAHNYLAVVARSLGWLDAAEAELQRAIELKPDYANAHFNLALMLLDRKPAAVELARRHYQKAVALGAEKDEIVEQKLKDN